MILDSEKIRLNGDRMPTGKSASQDPELQFNEAMLIEATHPSARTAKVAEYWLRLSARARVHRAQVGQADNANQIPSPNFPAASVNGLETTSQ